MCQLAEVSDSMSDALSNRDNRIKHRAIGIGKRGDLVERGRVGDRAAATDEFGPVRFVGRAARRRALRGHQMEHPRRFLAGRARPARAENGLRVTEDLGLHEQIAEGRVREVGVQRSDDDFRVTGQLDGAGLGRKIRQRYAADFDVVFGRHGDFRVGVNVLRRGGDIRRGPGTKIAS